MIKILVEILNIIDSILSKNNWLGYAKETLLSPAILTLLNRLRGIGSRKRRFGGSADEAGIKNKCASVEFKKPYYPLCQKNHKS